MPDRFVNVIVPLRIDWKPCYRLPENVNATVGDRVRVRFGAGECIGVVHGTGVVPELESARVQNIISVESSLAPVTGSEIKLWDFCSDYYLCSLGEVYKAAYPAVRTDAELKKARGRKLQQGSMARAGTVTGDSLVLAGKVLEAFDDGKPVLLKSDDLRVVRAIAERSLADDGGVLILAPEAIDPAGIFGSAAATMAESGVLMEYNSGITPASRRNVAAALRTTAPHIVLGTRSAVFLPFRNLKTVIILDESDPSYKQSEPAPRYNGRDLAVALAAIQGAKVLLCSRVPSLESLANCESGKYNQVDASAGAPQPGFPPAEIIDTSAEKRKNGMVGMYSRKLLAMMEATLASKGRVLVLLPWKNTDDAEIEARGRFPQARTRLVFGRAADYAGRDLSKYSLVVLLFAEYLVSGSDFRADEKAYRLLWRLRSALAKCAKESPSPVPFVIQTSDASHPVFSAGTPEDALAQMLSVRRQFRLPPHSRLVDIVFKDGNDARRRKLMAELSLQIASALQRGIPGAELCGRDDSHLRIRFLKSPAIRESKNEMRKLIERFALARKYQSHIHIDVDPIQL